MGSGARPSSRRRALLVLFALLASTVVAATGGGPASAAPSLGPLEDLGGLPGGTGAGAAYDVNDAGQIVGRTQVPGPAGPRWAAFRWDPGTGTMVDVGPASAADVTATGINDGGDVVGEVAGGPAFRSDGTSGLVEDLPLDRAADIADDGTVVGAELVFSSLFGVDLPRAALVDGSTGALRAALVPGTVWSALTDVDDAGVATGTGTREGSCPATCLVTKGLQGDTTVDPVTYERVEEVAPWEPPFDSSADAISSDGHVAGTLVRVATLTSAAFVVGDGGRRGLLPLPSGSAAQPTGVTADEVVVGSSRDALGRTRAVVWLPGRASPIDLGTLGGDESRAHEVSDTGMVVGEAQDAAGVWRPFRLQLPGMVATIAGTVTDPDGLPVAGAVVQAYAPEDGWLGSARTTTAPDGTYQLTGVVPGSHKVLATLPGGNLVAAWYDGALTRGAADALDVGAGASLTGIDLALGAGATVGGTVVDPAGAAVAGVTVGLYVPGTWLPLYVATTAADGTWRRTDVALGEYLVHISPPAGDLLPELWRDAPTLADASSITATAGAPLLGVDAALDVEGPSAVAGRVVAEGGVPVVGAVVRAHPAGDPAQEAASATTDATGAYAFDTLGAGTYLLEVEPPPGVGVLGEWYQDAAGAAGAAPVVVAPPRTTVLPAVVLALDPAVERGIAGTVTDGGGAPAPDVQVLVVEVGGVFPVAATTTAADGTWSVTGLAPGDHEVLFNAPDPRVDDEWYDDAADRTGATPVAVPPAGVVGGVDAQLAAVPLDRLVVHVVGPDGQPPGFVFVDLFAEGDTAVPSYSRSVDNVGWMTLDGIAPGTYEVRLRATPATGLLTEWYDDAPDRASATSLVVPGPLPFIDAQLAAAP